MAIRYRSYDDDGAAVADMLDALLGHGRASLTGTPPNQQGQRRGSVAPAALVGRKGWTGTANPTRPARRVFRARKAPTRGWPGLRKTTTSLV